MPELSEMIRGHVDAVAPHVTLEDVWARTGRAPATRPAGPRRRRVRVGLIVSAAALAVALVAVLVIVTAASPQSSAAATLNQAALVAASRPSGPVAGTHQYLYYDVTEGGVQATPGWAGHASVLYNESETLDTWVAPDGSGRQRITYSPDSVVLPSQQAEWDGPPALVTPPTTSDIAFPTTFAGSHPVGGPLVVPRSTQSSYVLSYPASAKFPTQPAALERAIERYFHVKHEGTTSIFFSAGNILQVGASPTLRAALFKLVEQLPGVSLLGPTKDASGRVGVGVALSTPHIRHILVFNPRTSAVLGELSVTRTTTSVLGTQVPKGTVIDFTTFGRSGVTSSITRLPGGTAAPMTATMSTGSGSSALYLPQR
jgi:hypothetical protein